jgi:sugar lactone lactonase YvrE
MSTAQPRLVVDCEAQVGEGPLWHPQSQTVYFTDIEGRRIIRYDPKTGRHDHVRESKGRVGGFTFERDGSMILFEEQSVIHRDNDGKERVLCEIKEGNPERFNDVKADPEGRVFLGTMGIEKGNGACIRVDRGGKYTILLENIRCGNGPSFSKDGTKFYFTDTFAKDIWVFDYDRPTGQIRNRRVFCTCNPETDGLPDGCTVDNEDHVWSARWGGYSLIRYRPDGSIERRIQFPPKQTTSLTFAGKDCTDIYVTSACWQMKKGSGPDAIGGLYHLNLGIKGIPEPPSRLVV